MPTFEYRGNFYNNPVELVMNEIGGKWKMPILWRLKDKTYRYGELRKSFENNNVKITHQMLTKQLRELEEDGYITRKVYAIVPPKVEYTMTGKGERVMPIIHKLRDFGMELIREDTLHD